MIKDILKSKKFSKMYDDIKVGVQDSTLDERTE